MRQINGRNIIHACATCVLYHAVIKEPLNKPEPVAGADRCDICEAIGQKDVPQSVFEIKKFGGVRPESYIDGQLIIFEKV